MTAIFPQNVIAVIWDFDKTMTPHYMQRPLFAHFGIDESAWWRSCNDELESLQASTDRRINRDTHYLNRLLDGVEDGTFPGLGNQLLRELGAGIDCYPGLLDFLDRSRTAIAGNVDHARFDIRLEHHVVSTGLAEMVRGSPMAAHLDGIWGCEFLERKGVISRIGYTIDNTTKTRAIFEINKGANANPAIHVNASMRQDERRVPIGHMIYIADGPSDVPAFSVVRNGGGRTFAVYDPADERSFEQAEQLNHDGRVHATGPADYRPDSHTSKWLMLQIRHIADGICAAKDGQISRGAQGLPTHLAELPAQRSGK